MLLFIIVKRVLFLCGVIVIFIWGCLVLLYLKLFCIRFCSIRISIGCENNIFFICLGLWKLSCLFVFLMVCWRLFFIVINIFFRWMGFCFSLLKEILVKICSEFIILWSIMVLLVINFRNFFFFVVWFCCLSFWFRRLEKLVIFWMGFFKLCEVM